MTKPFRIGEYYVIIENGKWIKFHSDSEANEYYDENKEEEK